MAGSTMESRKRNSPGFATDMGPESLVGQLSPFHSKVQIESLWADSVQITVSAILRHRPPPDTADTALAASGIIVCLNGLCWQAISWGLKQFRKFLKLSTGRVPRMKFSETFCNLSANYRNRHP